MDMMIICVMHMLFMGFCLGYVAIDEELTFDLAEEYCLATLGTNLASIHNENNETDASNKCLEKINLVTNVNHIYKCFIGLNDKDSDYIFVYSDDTPNDYSDSWKKGRPKIKKSGSKSGSKSAGAKSAGNEGTCVYMKYDSKKDYFEWEEDDCSTTLAYFICNPPESGIPTNNINLNDINKLIGGESIDSNNYNLRFIIDEITGNILAQEQNDNGEWETYYSGDITNNDAGNYISGDDNGNIYVYNSMDEIISDLYINSNNDCIGSNIVISNYGEVGIYSDDNILCSVLVSTPNTQSVNAISGQYGGITRDALGRIVTTTSNDRLSNNGNSDADDDSIANLFCGGQDDKPLWASLLSLNEDLWNELIGFDDDNIGVIQEHIQCSEVIYLIVVNAFPGGIRNIGKGLDVLNLLLELIQQIDLTQEFVQDIIGEINEIILLLLNGIDIPDIIDWESKYNNDDTQIFNPFNLIYEFAKLLSKLICDKKFEGTPQDFLNNMVDDSDENPPIFDLVETYNNTIYEFLVNGNGDRYFGQDLRDELLTNNFYQNFAFAPTFGMQICFTIFIPGCSICKFNICMKHTYGISINLKQEYEIFEGRIASIEIPIPPPETVGFEFGGILFYDFLSNYQDVINTDRREIFTIGAALDFSGFEELEYILQIWDYFSFFMDELPIATFDNLPISWIDNEINDDQNSFLLSILTGGVSASLEIVGVLDINTLLKCNGFRIVAGDTCGLEDGFSGKILASNGIRANIDTIAMGTEWTDDMKADLVRFMIEFITNHVKNGGADPNKIIGALQDAGEAVLDLGQDLTENILDETEKFFQETVVKLILSLLQKVIDLYNDLIGEIKKGKALLSANLDKLTNVEFCVYLPKFESPWHQKKCPSLEFISNLDDFADIIFDPMINGLTIPSDILNVDNDYDKTVNEILLSKINILTTTMNKLIDELNPTAFGNLLFNGLTSTMDQIENKIVDIIEETSELALKLLLQGLKVVLDALRISLNTGKNQFNSKLNAISQLTESASIPLPWGGNVDIGFKINGLSTFANIIFNHLIDAVSVASSITNIEDLISISKTDASSIKSAIDNRLNNILKPMFSKFDNFNTNQFESALIAILKSFASQGETFGNNVKNEIESGINEALSKIFAPINSFQSKINSAKSSCKSKFDAGFTINFGHFGDKTINIGDIIGSAIGALCDGVFSPITTALNGIPKPSNAAELKNVFSAHSQPINQDDEDNENNDNNDNGYSEWKDDEIINVSMSTKVYIVFILYTMIMYIIGVTAAIYIYRCFIKNKHRKYKIVNYIGSDTDTDTDVDIYDENVENKLIVHHH